MSVQGFWGLRVEPKKTYSQVVEAPFRVSMASLGDDINGKARTSLWVKVDKKDFVLCSLTPEKTEQQPLDITFVEGEEVTFTAKGNNTIHLTGNYVFDDEDEEGGANMSDLAALLNERRDLIDDEAEEDSDEEIDSDEDMEEDEEDEEEEEEEEEEEVEEPVKAAKKDKKRPAETEEDKPAKKAKADEAAQKQQEQKKQQELKKQEQKKKQEEQKKKQEEAKKAEELKKKQAEKKKQEDAKKAETQIKKLPNGMIIEDVAVGEGEVAKAGRTVGMRYIGKLKNGKVFDKNTSGKPFFFKLGRGEVIKGWDIGVAGMKIGGSRKLTIPSPLGYGKRGALPDIPKNADLVFDVKLVAIK